MNLFAIGGMWYFAGAVFALVVFTEGFRRGIFSGWRDIAIAILIVGTLILGGITLLISA